MNLNDLERVILGEVWTSPSLWDSLSYLCDDCNGRLTGSQDELKAGDYLLKRFQEFGLQNVKAETFDMPGWVRGETRLTLLDSANPRDLFCMALVGSPACEVEAEIIDLEAGKDADFDRLAEKIAGNILLTGPEGPHRLEKYLKAQTAGAAALLIAQGQPGNTISAGSLGLRSAEPTLPILSLTHESTVYLRRILKRGPVRARLVFAGGRHPGTARNISAELPGSDPMHGWVIACGHYDGHDIGQAAQDNATGTAVVLEAARLLAPFQKEMQVGIRFVLFAGEEEGIYGSPAYVAAHPSDWDSIRLVFNADIVGCAAPLNLKTQNSPELAAYLKQLPLADLGAVVDDSDFINNSDHFSFSAVGISSLWAVTAAAGEGKYWVHSSSDTLDKLDLTSVRQAAATTARLLLRMSTQPKELPRGRKTPEEIKQIILDKGWEKLLRMQNRCPF
jgi:aminopeptidase YwaD